LIGLFVVRSLSVWSSCRFSPPEKTQDEIPIPADSNRADVSESSNSAWWYGVVLFPLAPVFRLVALLGVTAFASTATTEYGVLVAIGAWFLTVIGSWLAILLSGVVLVSLYFDTRTLADGGWSPTRLAVISAGVVHFVAGFLSPLYVVSVPSLLYYSYHRHKAD